MKKVFSVFFITLMVLGSFTIGYCHNYPVYAEIHDENLYEPLRQQSDLVKAFQAYCKSRDLTVEGSALDAVTTWTTSAFNTACNNVGLNMTQIQAEIKAQYDENGQPLKYLFYATGVDAFNRIFAQFLQDNELEVGDTDVNKQVYSGDYFVDDDGNRCLVYVVDSALTVSLRTSKNHILQYGSPLKYNFSDLKSLCPLGSYYNFTFNIFGRSYRGDKTTSNSSNGLGYACYTGRFASARNITVYSVYDEYWAFGADGYNLYGYPTIVKGSDGKYLVGIMGFNNAWNAYNTNNFQFKGVQINTSPNGGNTNIIPNTNIYIYAPTINNNTYEGDTIYYPDGTPVDPDDPSENPPVVGPDPDQPTDPLPPVDPDYPDDPVTPQTPPDWDIELPDFTDFDWIMTGLEKKFPWDIPFNIMFMMSLFVAEPEAPHFVGDIDLKVTTWHYDLDLSPFEEIAKLFRTFFFLGFILGLMLLTKQLIWG